MCAHDEGLKRLHEAAIISFGEDMGAAMAKCQIDSGADVNARTVVLKRTPLHYAAIMANVKLVCLLIARGFSLILLIIRLSKHNFLLDFEN